jgi:CMP-N-acetylneuraminic acid synthetase
MLRNPQNWTLFKSMARTEPLTLCLIPARGGSKGIPGKNVRECDGKPLVDFTIDTALELFGTADVVVTSDDDRVLERARERGVVSLQRPAFIAQDDTPMISVIQHALMATNYAYARLLLLQPTSPYRSVAEIRVAMTQLEEEDADLIASVSAVPDESSPYLMVKIDDGQMVPVLPGQVPTRRQDVPRAYLRNGQFYVMRTKPIIHGRGLYDGKVLAYVTADRGVNLDTEADWVDFVSRQTLDHAS